MGGGGVLEEWMSTFLNLPKYNCDQNLCNTFEKSVELVPFMGYCSVLNNRLLLIIIRGDIQSIKTWHFSKQSPSISFRLFPHEKLGIYPKFELHRTKTVEFRTKWNFIWANVPNSHMGPVIKHTTVHYIVWDRLSNKEFGFPSKGILVPIQSHPVRSFLPCETDRWFFR